MPILTPIGRRTAGGRLTVAGIYVLLIGGGATMVYPFLLMVSTALTGKTDYQEFRVVPRYLYDDRARYAKFLAEKYQRLGDLKALRDFNDAAEGFTSTPDPHAVAAARDWHDFERTLGPRDSGVWHVGRRSMPGKVEMRWRDFLRERFGDAAAVNRSLGTTYADLAAIAWPLAAPTPEELFKAARLDGAGEMRMLWQIAVPLCKPILAMIMLFTFTATYGSYIWALVVCQDERMWTLMVHLFQLQQWAPTYVTMAANVIASLPTLLVFIVAQNMIMRGVIIPAYT